MSTGDNGGMLGGWQGIMAGVLVGWQGIMAGVLVGRQGITAGVLWVGRIRERRTPGSA